MNTPEARQRLTDAMEARRLELGLTWREVAAAGGLSYEVVRAARTDFSRDMRPLTVAGIAKGLRWTPDSVRRILEGHDPVPLETADEEAAHASRPRPLQSPARARVRRMATIQATATLVLHEVDQARRLNPAATAEDIFGGPDGDPDEVYIWSLEGMTEETRADHIAVLRWELAREEDERHRNRKRAG